MAERLWQRHTERAKEGALRYKANRDMVLEFVGPGGVRLSEAEQFQLYRDAVADPQMMVGILQNLQRKHKLSPEQVPREFVEWDKKFSAMEATERPLAATEGLQDRSQR